MKKMIALIFTLFIIMSVICIKQYLDISDYKSEIKAAAANKIKSCEKYEDTEESENQMNESMNPDGYADVAIRYIKTIKSGKSTDLYSDKLKKVKDILSEGLLDKLSPDMTEKEIEAEKAYIKNIDKDSITTTRVTDINYSYYKRNNNTYEVTVIYTLRTLQGDRNDLQRYLSRLYIEKADKGYKITNILEDSTLSDGIY